MNTLRLLQSSCKLLSRRNITRNNLSNFFSQNKQISNVAILGIETSCDDTGCAIINEKGELLSETLHSQTLMHLRNGGVIPDIAQDLHRRNIERVVAETLQKADLAMDKITAIAVTLEPGLALSLEIGMKYAKYLARSYSKPIIPIHHMQAHALAARMQQDVPFPFLVLLISGGHCLLAVVKDVNKFYLLGESIDCAPGEIFDKVARKMKLRNIPEYSQICGGLAVELAASKAKDPKAFNLPLPLHEQKNCNFSFNGLKTAVLLHLHRKEKLHKIVADEIIPEANDLCAALLIATSKHLVHRTQRAIEFCEQNKLLPTANKNLVVSGGVACNNFIFAALSSMCKELDLNITRPPPRLCTDNGVMIAWNGLEKWRQNIDITTNFKALDLKASSDIGENLIPLVKKSQIPVKLMKLKYECAYSVFFIL